MAKRSLCVWSGLVLSDNQENGGPLPPRNIDRYFAALHRRPHTHSSSIHDCRHRRFIHPPPTVYLSACFMFWRGSLATVAHMYHLCSSFPPSSLRCKSAPFHGKIDSLCMKSNLTDFFFFNYWISPAFICCSWKNTRLWTSSTVSYRDICPWSPAASWVPDKGGKKKIKWQPHTRPGTTRALVFIT